MCLKVVSSEDLKEESDIIKSLYISIDRNENIIFDSGAGSGKTYALIESLKYIIGNYYLSLKDNNQNILCITYTNVATNEVNERLGNNSFVKVSTIHERIWELIKDFQNELVKIHIKNIKEELIHLNNDIEEDSKLLKFKSLSSEEKITFIQIAQDNIEVFYDYQNKPAGIFKDEMKKYFIGYDDLLSNVENFKKIVKTLYKIKNFENCITSIERKDEKYCKVIYDSRYNVDRLHRMRISHDTLLKYGFEIINEYKLLRQIIFDKYPYILVDEYQDTNEYVIKIMHLLDTYSKEINHNLFIGYFGDTAQNIYEDGIGRKINELHPGLTTIIKRYNRRSTIEVIDLINTIRNDEIKQQSIYHDCSGGSVKFYVSKREDLKSVITHYHSKWNINLDNKLNCLVLTNRILSEYSGFSNLWNYISRSEYYRINFNQIKTELLSQDISKLGEIPSLIYKFIKIDYLVRSDKSILPDLLNSEVYNSMNISNVRDLVRLLKSIQADSLKSYITELFKKYNDKTNSHLVKMLNYLFDFDTLSLEIVQNSFMESLYPNILSEKIPEATTNIESILDISLDEYRKWFSFLSGEVNEDVIYHTYHGTKGLEFDNVIIIMENAFGRDRNYFNGYFQNVLKEIKDDEDKFEQIKNLLYVSCSRAIKNLRIIYLDDISSFKDGVLNIFGTVTDFPT